MKYNHNEKSIKLLNSIIYNYKEIESDKDLRTRKLSYSDYQNLGFLIDTLRYEGKANTFIKSIADYFKKLGCKVELQEIQYIISL